MSTTTDATRRLRRRLTGLSVLVVAVVLLVAAVALLVLQRGQLTAAVEERLDRRADAVALALATNPDSPLAVTDPEDELIQVVAEGGSVMASSANLAGQPPVAPPPAGRQDISTVDALPLEDDRYLILSRRVRVGSSTVVVHVAENVDDIDDAVRALGLSLLLAFPAVLLVLGALTWLMVGRTLAPVDAAAARQARFVSDASHELRSPLARIRTRLEVDLAHPEGVDLRGTASAVLDEVRSMDRLVGDLLVLAQSDEASAAPPRTAVDLDDVVLAEATLHRSERGVRLDTSAVSGASVRGDPDDLTRVVRNLLDNAVRHADGLVQVHLREHDGVAILVVDDDGPGIPAERRKEVFDRFTRLDEARSPGDGSTGLGLAIARDLVERLGGTIEVADAPIGGARFAVRLPAA